MDPDEEPPPVLDAEGAAEWARVLDVCRHRTDWLQGTDRAALTAYCSAWTRYYHAAADVAGRGILVPGRSSADAARSGAGLVRNPSVGIERDAARDLRGWCQVLGFTPDSRGRATIGRIKAETTNPATRDFFE